MIKVDYPVSIWPFRQEEGGGYIAEIFDLSGRRRDCETREEAFEEALSAINSWVKIAQEFGDWIPTFSLLKT